MDVLRDVCPDSVADAKINMTNLKHNPVINGGNQKHTCH